MKYVSLYLFHSFKKTLFWASNEAYEEVIVAKQHLAQMVINSSIRSVHDDHKLIV